MSLTNNLESKILDNFRYLGISGQAYTDVQKLAALGRAFESLSDSWEIKRDISFVDAYGGRHGEPLMRFASGSTNELTLNVPQLIKKIQSIYDIKFSSTSINLNDD